MQWLKSLPAAMLCGSFFLPAMLGCDGGDRDPQVRDEVLDIETSEGESLEIGNGEIGEGEVDDNVNIDVQDND